MLALALVALVLGSFIGGRLYSDYLVGPSTFGSSVIEFAKLISEALILFCKNNLISESTAQREGCCILVY